MPNQAKLNCMILCVCLLPSAFATLSSSIHQDESSLCVVFLQRTCTCIANPYYFSHGSFVGFVGLERSNVFKKPSCIRHSGRRIYIEFCLTLTTSLQSDCQTPSCSYMETKTWRVFFRSGKWKACIWPAAVHCSTKAKSLSCTISLRARLGMLCPYLSMILSTDTVKSEDESQPSLLHGCA